MRLSRGRVQREFLSKDALIACVSQSNNFDPSEDLESADGFLIFQSDFFKSWLVATRLRLYNIIDDIRRRDARINWSISRSKIFVTGGLTLDIEVREAKDKTGQGGSSIDIGYRPGNPFSPELFPANDVAERIVALVRERMS